MGIVATQVHVDDTICKLVGNVQPVRARRLKTKMVGPMHLQHPLRAPLGPCEGAIC